MTGLSSSDNTPRWHLSNPEILPETDPSHLCPTCRHIDFRYLLFDVPFLSCPEIPLGSLQRAFSTHSCAFCQLVTATVNGVFHSDFETFPLELEGKPIMLFVMPLGESLEASKPRQLVLRLKPSPWENKWDSASRSIKIQVVRKDAFLNGDGFGRLIDPVKVNNLVALYWIRACRLGYGLHKEDRPKELHGQAPPGFRLIDLYRNCIVPVGSRSCDYVTLSYVWPPPGKPMLMLLTSNKAGLIERDGCLVDPDRPFAAMIPQTIRDAMEICKSVGETYLWVDALCIIQDDDADRDAQIRAMDYIYSSSALTLASTCGDSAEASIPRTPNLKLSSETSSTSPSYQIDARIQSITLASKCGDSAEASIPQTPGKQHLPSSSEKKLPTSSSSFTQKIIQIQSDLILANRPWSFSRAVRQSKWSTRAWTCQEQILSRRTLFLTPQQMFFKCVHSPTYLSEDLDLSPKRRQLVTYPMDDTGTDLIPARGSINILTYNHTVKNFTQRSVTYADDVLNAFTGIAERMRTIFRSGLLFGLPMSELDYALSWQPLQTGSSIRRRRQRLYRNNPASGEEKEVVTLFPSWSWAGWFGAVEYTFENRLPRVRWVVHHHDHHDETGASSKLRSPEAYRAPTAATGEEDLTKWRQEWTEKRSHSGFRYFYHESDKEAWFRNPTAPEAERAGNQGPTCVPGTPQGHLRFEAEVIDISVHHDFVPPRGVDESVNPLWQFALNDDQHGGATGYFILPLAEAKEMSSKKKYKFVRINRVGHGLDSDKIMLKKEKGGTEVPPGRNGTVLEDDPGLVFEDLDGDGDLVRDNTSSAGQGGPTAEEEWMYNLCFDRLRYDPLRPFCLSEFLVVEVIGEVAYRIGIGRMHVDAWAQEPPKTEIITLG